MDRLLSMPALSTVPRWLRDNHPWRKWRQIVIGYTFDWSWESIDSGRYIGTDLVAQTLKVFGMNPWMGDETRKKPSLCSWFVKGEEVASSYCFFNMTKIFYVQIRISMNTVKSRNLGRGSPTISRLSFRNPLDANHSGLSMIFHKSPDSTISQSVVEDIFVSELCEDSCDLDSSTGCEYTGSKKRIFTSR